MRAFRVQLPSGIQYWTVVDDELRLFEPADRFLRELRLAQGRAESTTKAYAHALVLLLLWCASTGRDWRIATQDMGLFMLWLRWTPGRGSQHRVVMPGPGSQPVRGDRRINKVLTAIRMFLIHAVNNKEAPAWVVGQIYELGDALDLPMAAQGESGMQVRLRARHRLQEPETDVDRASDEEVVAMFLACRSAPASMRRAPRRPTAHRSGLPPRKPAERRAPPRHAGRPDPRRRGRGPGHCRSRAAPGRCSRGHGAATHSAVFRPTATSHSAAADPP